MPRVLPVEDSSDMHQTPSDYLKIRGFDVHAVDSTEDGIDEVNDFDFDIGLIDVNLPRKSGFDMIEYIREQDNAMPLIALTARSDIADKLRGFTLGATDYLVKPFNLQELLARMEAHMKQARPTNDTADIKITKYTLSPAKHSFKIKSEEVELTNTEFRILHILLMNHGAVVTTTDIIEFAWDESHMLERPISGYTSGICGVKIGDTDFKIIKTIPGTGYKIEDSLGHNNAANCVCWLLSMTEYQHTQYGQRLHSSFVRAPYSTPHYNIFTTPINLLS